MPACCQLWPKSNKSLHRTENRAEAAIGLWENGRRGWWWTREKAEEEVVLAVDECSHGVEDRCDLGNQAGEDERKERRGVGGRRGRGLGVGLRKSSTSRKL